MNTEPTINILSILLLLGGFSGIVYAILLLQSDKNRIANRYFAAIMAATAILLLNQFLVENE